MELGRSVCGRDHHQIVDRIGEQDELQKTPDRILNVVPEGEQKVLREFRRETEKGRPAVRLEVAVPTRSGPPAKVRRLGQRAGGINITNC